MKVVVAFYAIAVLSASAATAHAHPAWLFISIAMVSLFAGMVHLARKARGL